MLPDVPALLRADVPRGRRQGPGPAVRARVQRLDGRGVVRGIRRTTPAAVSRPVVGSGARGRGGAPQRRPRRARGVLLRAARQPRPAVGARSRAPLGSVRRGVRRDRHRHLHAQRLGVEDAVDLRRRAAGGLVDADPRARRGLAGGLALLGAARAPPERDAHLLRGPDRLDPLHPRPGRPGLGAQPGLERLARPGAGAAQHVLLGPGVRLLLRRRRRPRRPRRDRPRPGDLRDRLPARRRHLAAQPGGGGEAPRRSPRRRGAQDRRAATRSGCWESRELEQLPVDRSPEVQEWRP